MSQMWSRRPIRRYIQLATPVNWDFGQWRHALNYGVQWRCQASSTADWKQFFGSSPYQVGNFFYNVYQSVAGAIQAFEALRNGDYESSAWWFASSVFDAIEADYWLDTTKIEVEGPTYHVRRPRAWRPSRAARVVRHRSALLLGSSAVVPVQTVTEITDVAAGTITVLIAETKEARVMRIPAEQRVPPANRPRPEVFEETTIGGHRVTKARAQGARGQRVEFWTAKDLGVVTWTSTRAGPSR